MPRARQEKADASAPRSAAAQWEGAVEFVPAAQRPANQPGPSMNFFADDKGNTGDQAVAKINEQGEDNESTPRAPEKGKGLLFGSAPAFQPVGGGGDLGSGAGNTLAPAANVQGFAPSQGHPMGAGGVNHPAFGNGTGGMFPLGFGNVVSGLESSNGGNLGNNAGMLHNPGPSATPATKGTPSIKKAPGATNPNDPPKPPREAEMQVACAKICRHIALEKIGPWEPTPENHHRVTEMLVFIGNYLLQGQFIPGPMMPFMGIYDQNAASAQAMNMNQMASGLVVNPQQLGGNGSLESAMMAQANMMAHAKMMANANIMANANAANMMANPNLMGNPNMMANQQGMATPMAAVPNGMSNIMFHQNGMPHMMMDPNVVALRNGAHNVVMGPDGGPMGFLPAAPTQPANFGSPDDHVPPRPSQRHARNQSRFLNNALRYNNRAPRDTAQETTGPAAADNGPAARNFNMAAPSQGVRVAAPRGEEQEHQRIMSLMQQFGGGTGAGGGVH